MFIKLAKRFSLILIVCFLLGILTHFLDTYDLQLRSILISATSILMAIYEDLFNTFTTPLASLTLAALVRVGLIVYLGNIVWATVRTIWIWWHEEDDIDDVLEPTSSSIKPDAARPQNPHKACCDFMSRIEESTTFHELNALYHEALGRWPEWEFMLTSVYQTRRSWILKNSD